MEFESFGYISERCEQRGDVCVGEGELFLFYCV